MKNILLMILVATIPFMSIAQKRSKKSNAKMGEFVKKSPNINFSVNETMSIKNSPANTERIFTNKKINTFK